MPPQSAPLVDLTHDLAAMARFGAAPEAIDDLIAETLDALGGIVPFDLATVMERRGEELAVRVARGPLSGRDAVRTHSLDLKSFPSIREVIERGHARAFVEDDHDDGDPFDGVLDLSHGHFCMVVPLNSAGKSIGVMTLDRSECGVYPASSVNLADVVGRLLAEMINYGEQSGRLTRIREQLEEQNRLLAEAAGGGSQACRLLEASVSPAMGHAVHLGRQVAPTDTPVLIGGETGTGKEVLAEAIHAWSARAAQPLIRINCAALPGSLIESELFGHVKGAFSGATRDRIGRFRAANGGTLFLDEVGELGAELQAKLLRVLQEGCFEPVGSDRTVRVDVRIVAATNRNLTDECAGGRFREDLYYRLAVFPITLPPLRARREDIPVIARGHLAALAARTGRGPWSLSDAEASALAKRDWPGNVRELINTLERATIMATGALVAIPGAASSRAANSAVASPDPVGDGPFPSLAEMERRHLRAALERAGGRMSGVGGAAELLGLHPNTLASRMKKLGVRRDAT